MMLLFVCGFTFSVLGVQLFGGLILSDPDSATNEHLKVGRRLGSKHLVYLPQLVGFANAFVDDCIEGSAQIVGRRCSTSNHPLMRIDPSRSFGAVRRIALCDKERRKCKCTLPFIVGVVCFLLLPDGSCGFL